MPSEPHHRHNGGPLSDEMRRKLWDHVRALEALDEQATEIRMDVSARKEIAKADGFDVNMLALILKRRKAGEGETAAADHIVRIYEEGLRDQGALPLEQTRVTKPARRPLEEIARDLHGEELPEMPERPDDAVAAKLADSPEFADAMREFVARNPGTSVRIGETIFD